jgi:hypothetical protein
VQNTDDLDSNSQGASTDFSQVTIGLAGTTVWVSGTVSFDLASDVDAVPGASAVHRRGFVVANSPTGFG